MTSFWIKLFKISVIRIGLYKGGSGKYIVYVYFHQLFIVVMALLAGNIFGLWNIIIGAVIINFRTKLAGISVGFESVALLAVSPDGINRHYQLRSAR